MHRACPSAQGLPPSRGPAVSQGACQLATGLPIGYGPASGYGPAISQGACHIPRACPSAQGLPYPKSLPTCTGPAISQEPAILHTACHIAHGLPYCTGPANLHRACHYRQRPALLHRGVGLACQPCAGVLAWPANPQRDFATTQACFYTKGQNSPLLARLELICTL